uniref:NB-ARC domain-containing protein n=1 Tax=Setaria digitata TaxID=48799 RepID=A0A915Q4G0_9BILA
MLLERHSRMLTIAAETLMQDFEPRDAIPYMCSEEIFSDDQQEIILGMTRRTLRVMEFIRQYRKSANTLDPLITYFEKYGQKHLAHLLSKDYVPEERPLLTSDALEDRLFLEGNVPRLPFYRVLRADLLEKLKDLLIDLSTQDQFWLVVHGFPGCGKSFLAANVLQAYPVLLSRYYEHVIWVEDGRTNTNQLSEVFSNFLFLVTDALALTGKETPAQFLPLAKAALREKPNTLVVLNDVYLQESVRWFDQLNCRILATSRNLEIFQVCFTSPLHFAIDPPCFSLMEMELMFRELLSSAVMNSSFYNEQLLYIHKRTMGLPAVLGIVRQQACDNYNGFCNLHRLLDCYAVATVSSFTYYKYKNMVDAIMESYKSLTSRQKTIMETFIIFGQNQWVPLELVLLCIPFDISGDQDTLYMAMQELEPLRKSSLLDKRLVRSDEKTENDVPLMYDFHINPIMYSFLCVTVDRQAIEASFFDRLRLYIRPSVSSFLLRHQRGKSYFMQRIRSFTDLRPSLFQEIFYEDCSPQSRVKLVLYNISQRPIVYKLKCEAKALITAEPNASGTIPAHGVGYCLLIWRRPPDVKNWKDIKVASIMMITEFEGSDDPNINEHTVTKIKCRISSSAVCTSANPPEEHVTFKSASDPSSSLRESSKSKLIIPFIGLPNSSTVPQMPSENVDKQTNSSEITLLMRKLLAQRRIKYGLYKFPKALEITDSKQIMNTYIDEEPRFDEALVPENEVERNSADFIKIACYDHTGTPFPGFLCPLMKIMAHQYGNWRSKVAENLTCEDLMDLSTHPCNHNTSSCVIMALPNSHLIFGCMDDHTGKFVAPQKWVGNNKKYAKYLLDFRGDAVVRLKLICLQGISIDNPLRLSQHCKKFGDGRPVCLRNNLFYRKFPILQQVTCCCKGDFCADVLFDQTVQFIVISGPKLSGYFIHLAERQLRNTT